MRTLKYALTLSLVFAACAKTDIDTPRPPASRDIGPLSATDNRIAWENCPSHTLQVTFNSHDTITKPDLQSAWRALARYPKLRYVPLEGAGHETMLRIHANDGCSELRCALNQGWEAIQTDLLLVPGTVISCDTSIEPVDKGRTTFCPSRSDQDPTQDAPKQDEAKQDGGVGVGN